MLTKDKIIEQLNTILRETALDGSDRDIVSGDSLGEDGIGLDSLALVQFLSAIEREFNAQIPVDVWSRVDQLTLDECAGVVLSTLR